MRKYSLFFAAIAASATLVLSCSKEIDAPGEETTPTTDVTDKDKEETPENKDENTGSPNYDGLFSITLTTPETKTEFGDKVGDSSYPKIWKAGDKINVNGEESNGLRDEDIKDDGASATFYFESQPKGDTYKVVYPYTAYAGEGRLSIPKVQNVDGSGKFDPAADIMIGTGGPNETISMTNSVAWLKIKLIKGDYGNFGVSSIQVSGKAGQKLNGTFTIDGDNIVDGVGVVTEEEKTITLNVEGVSSLDETAKEFLIAVAPKDIEGISVTVTDSKGYTMTKTSSSKLTKGQILALPEIKFQEYYPITNAADLVKFANEYNAGELDHPYALLKNDINFSEAPTSFNDTGGIGTPFGGDNYFKGIFNGNNATISNLTSSVPLFGGIDSGSLVKDLTIDETCSFTFTRPTTDEKFYGALAGYHKGTVTGVSVAADVSLAAVSDVAGETGLGGLVGRMADEGMIDASTYSGNLIVPSGFVTSANNVYVRVGGLVGFSLSTTTKINNSHMVGTIDYAAVLTAPSSNNMTPYVTLGGIIGQNKGAVTGCDTACLDDAGDGAIKYDASDGNTYYATIVNHSTQTHCLAEGGIVGYNYGGGTISSCTNRAKIMTNIIGSGADATTVDKSARYFRIGGIAGMSNASTITGCDNYGEIINSSTARIQVSGGIVGLNYGVGELSACNNYSSGTIDFIATGAQLSTSGDIDVRSPYVGGIIGTNQSSTVSDVHNYADLTISCIESDVTNYDVDLGGVIGHNESAIDGGVSTKDITNSGKVYASFSANGATGISQGIDLGGVVGSSSASVQNAVNSGYVLFSGRSGETVLQKIFVGGIVGRMTATGNINGCENQTGSGANDGEIYFSFDNNLTLHTDNYAGGILGYSSTGVNISSCTNGGYVHAGNGSPNKAGATCYVGGIVAYLSGTGSEISNCTNTGNVYCHHRNNSNNAKNNSTYTGGIAGEVVGTSENRISIDHCTVNPAGNVSSHRGWVGGVVGYAEYADISSCTHNKNFGKENTSAYFVGGIVGWALNCELSSCSWSGTTIDSSQLQANGGAGIVAKMDGGTLDGCFSYVTTIQKSSSNVSGGALVGIALNTPTIKNCHYKTSINSAAANLASTGTFTDGEGNVADL